MRRNAVASAIIVLVVVLLVAIPKFVRQFQPLELGGSRFAPFQGAQLATEYRHVTATGKDIALLHVLFVPRDVPAPRRGWGVGGQSGGTVHESFLGYDYSDHDRVRPITTHPIRILDSRTVRADDGRSFDLARGNVFVADVDDDGHVRLSQLPMVRQAKDEPAESVVMAIQAAVPGNEHIQALDARVESPNHAPARFHSRPRV